MISPRPVIFTGSSIIALWEGLPALACGHPVYNTAISGSQTADLIPQLDELVICHAPILLCYYCGSNDINNAIPPKTILANTIRTFEIVRAAIPDLRFVYLSIIKAPQKQDRWDLVDQVNAEMEHMARSLPGLGYIDVNPLFFDGAGQPRAGFYIEDQLHLTPAAYTALNDCLFALLAERLQ